MPPPNTTETAKIECRHLWKIFGKHPQRIQQALSHGRSQQEILEETGHVIAVQDVSFSVPAGQIFVVMGLSGSGKSTLIRCLSRLIEPTDGQVLLDGRNLLQLTEKELRHVRRHEMSMVFQRFGLFPHRRVIDNVAYGLEVQGLGKQERHGRAADILDMVGLSTWSHHFPHELSGGMQQRVGLARALAVDPQILLCDEPFSALDPLIRREMQDELIHLQQTLKKTIIFITHDFLEALKLGDQIAIMKEGQIVQMGTPAHIVSNPINAYVEAFAKDAPRAKILTAADVMQSPAPHDTSVPPLVPATTPLEQLIELVVAHEHPLTVVDGEKQPLGFINRTAVLRALAS